MWIIGMCVSNYYYYLAEDFHSFSLSIQLQAAIEANKFFKGTDLDVKNDVSHLETQELIHNTKITLSDFSK